MNPFSDAPSRRSVSALALWSAPVVALAIAAPAVAASGAPTATTEQAGWNVAARSGRNLSSGTLIDYTGFAFSETAALVPTASVSFIETYAVVVTAEWSQFADGTAARAAAASLASSIRNATMVAPPQSTPAVVVEPWSSVTGPTDEGPKIGYANPEVGPDAGTWVQKIRWTATRTVSIIGLGASGQAGYSEIAAFERPYNSQSAVFSFALSPLTGSGAVAGDDAPTLAGTVTVAPSPYTPPAPPPGGGTVPGGTSTSTSSPAPGSGPSVPSSPSPTPTPTRTSPPVPVFTVG